MKNNEALFVYANKKPLKMSVKPYYKNKRYNAISKLKPFKIKGLEFDDNIEYIDID